MSVFGVFFPLLLMVCAGFEMFVTWLRGIETIYFFVVGPDFILGTDS
jgi:hypothetical protein